jgi:phosphate transport system substrate-binding protein
VTLLVAGSASPTAANATTVLTGAGSTLIAPLEAEWAVAFQAFHGDVTVNFVANGSQAGINAITSRAADFGASDAPMTSSQLSACGRCFQIPWALTGIGIGYRVDGIRANLYLTGNVLAGIFLGQIRRWNDRRIRAVNPRAHLPNLAITPIYTGGSGSTYAFTRYLSKVSQSWRSRIGYGSSVAFPTGVSAKTTSSATSLVHSTNGSIAYIAASWLIADRLPAAAVENAAGRFVYPNLSNIETAGRTVTQVPSGNAIDITNPSRSAVVAYPISTYTWVIVAGDARQKGAVEDWLQYVLSAGQQFGPQLDFAALPTNVERAMDATYNQFAR